uniref:NADH-ubiquinone oxidoreductase chain 5 n=1 Tax=Pachydactylus punctatus TaxID=185352 RepID=A0A7R7G1P5_9SAUR|nr:NADH dehydrogenase subunit 5 [Pachydactylus punctatus]
MITNLFHSTTVIVLLTLLAPLLGVGQRGHIFPVSATRYATMLSLIPTIIFINSGYQTITMNINWLTTHFNLQISFMFDQYSMLFLPVALLITHSILQFSLWYMNSDPHHTKFAQYLTLFLIAMLTLTTANNMLQLFIGWEGVGIMSFLLINWWSGRTNANTSALQAVIYNRIGDIGLILTLTWLAMNLNTWDMQQMFSHTTTPTLPLIGLVLAATGKSAQFGLHPWLPAAMEGPTPVSALLHSSTMVVAGIFLLVRLHPLLQTNTHVLTMCLCMGALTTTFAALCALTQNDIKKIIAFSTSSQLGLMMVTIGMNQPELAFLHITTHAFFKAMLFLCSGSIIHTLENEQDIRKMGGLHHTLPITASCMTLGNLALIGTPFLAGFFTKDTIIETMNTSSLNAWALTITMLATSLTAFYSLRLIFFTHLHPPHHLPITPLAENNKNQTHPIILLAMGSITSGLIITSTMIPNKPQVLTMPTTIKLSTIIVTLLGLTSAMDLTKLNQKLIMPTFSTPHTMLTQLGFFNTLLHRTMPKTNMTLARTISLQLKDNMWYEALGPNMVKLLSTTTSHTLSSAHTGTIKTHLTSFIAMLSCLTLLALPL